VGGGHYAKYAIQPLEFIVKNKIGFLEGNVIKYVVRWKDKAGLEDLKKARHYLDMLIELESSKTENPFAAQQAGVIGQDNGWTEQVKQYQIWREKNDS
jgi:hypothetical protein